jgi:hypothetical protein
MKKQLQLGLVVEGNSTESTVLHLPRLVEELGPVKSTVLRVARRVSNMLKAGYAVADYEELQAASLILLRVPDASVPRVVDELCSSELIFKDLSFVLCESWLPVGELSALTSKGAAVATLMSLPTHKKGSWFAVEGQMKAVRQIRQFLERNEVRSNEILPDSKHLLFASELLATALPMPLLVAAQQALRAAGISGKVLSALLEQIMQRMVQDFLKGARANWGGPLTECSEETGQIYLNQLRQSHPTMSSLIEEHLASGRQIMQAHRQGAEELQSFRQAAP